MWLIPKDDKLCHEVKSGRSLIPYREGPLANQTESFLPTSCPCTGTEVSNKQEGLWEHGHPAWTYTK